MSVGEDEAEQFSLRWNNFHNNLTHGFHELLEEEDLVDVTLACDGKYVQAHKIVLSVCSPYFKSLFRDNPCRHPIVILKDVGHKELQAILQFMYRGEVNVRQDDLTGFLKTAEMLKIKGLTGENNDKDSQKRSFSEEKRRPRGAPTHCDDEASPVPFKRVKQEQRRSRVVTHPSSRAHSPVECIPPSSVSREELMQPEFDVTKPKEEPVDYSQAEDEYSSELGPSIPHEIDEGMEEVEEEVTGEEVSEGRPRGSGRNHLPSEGQGGGGDQPPSALAAMAHLVHAGGPSGSDGQRQGGIEPKHLPPLALPSISGAVMEPNVTLQMESKERLQGTGMFPGSSGLSQDSSSSQDISQGVSWVNEDEIRASNSGTYKQTQSRIVVEDGAIWVPSSIDESSRDDVEIVDESSEFECFGGASSSRTMEDEEQVELVTGCGIWVKKREMDTILIKSRGDGNKMIREIINVKFSLDEQARLSAKGTRTLGMGNNLLLAVRDFVSMHATEKLGWSRIVKLINIKFANARKAVKKRQMMESRTTAEISFHR